MQRHRAYSAVGAVPLRGTRTWRSILAVVVALTMMVAGSVGVWAQASSPVTIRVGNLAFPALSSIIAAIVKAKGFDEDHGIQMDVRNYANISAYYAALAVGEIDTLPGGPNVLQRMRTQGVPITATNTFIRLNAYVITADPAFQSLADLKGKRIAADMGSSQYQVMRVIAQSQGVILGDDVEVVQAGPPLARTHLRTGEVDAAMSFEPQATLTLTDNPDYRIIYDAEAEWEDLTGVSGWELLSLTREEWVQRHPDAVDRWIKTLDDAARFLAEHPEEAAAILEAEMNVPAEVFLRAQREGRLQFDIRRAVDEEDALNEMFRAAVYSGFLPRLPDEGAIYRP